MQKKRLLLTKFASLFESNNIYTEYEVKRIIKNLYKPFESIKFRLSLGKIRIKGLQDDWNEYGEEAFEFKVVEILKKRQDAT